MLCTSLSAGLPRSPRLLTKLVCERSAPSQHAGFLRVRTRAGEVCVDAWSVGCRFAKRVARQMSLCEACGPSDVAAAGPYVHADHGTHGVKQPHCAHAWWDASATRHLHN
eukprot:1195245-Prorocentrum_minimum.AAC.4